MELRHLRYFVAVAEELHFARAAGRLGIAQPPLTRQIQQLEAELGFALFERKRPRVALTESGQVLLGHARQVFELLNVATREARRASTGERGRISVGYPSSLAYSGLIELLRAFRAARPEVELTLHELDPGSQIRALKRGQLEIGFLRGPVEEPGLTCELVRRESLMLALPIDHPLTSRRRVPLSSLAQERFVFFPRERGPAFYDLLLGLCQRAGFTPKIAHEAPQVDILSLVGAGFGISIVPASVRQMRRVDLVLRPIVGAPSSELLIAWRSADTSPVRRQFVELVRQLGIRRARRSSKAPR